MENDAYKLTVSRTAHYYSIGEPSEKIERLWIVCHGYGQLAKTFIRRFEDLEDGKTLVLAPEGLSKFYWEGFTGKPVASWMTREHRLDEIEDYCNYLKKLYELYMPQLSENVKVTILGFSQGTATVTRWLMRDFPKIDHLILWAGSLPDDIDFAPHADYFNSKKLVFAYGDKDPFLTEKRMTWVKKLIEKNKLEFEEFPFEGEHTVEREALKRLVQGL